MAEKNEKVPSQSQQTVATDAWKKTLDDSQQRMGQVYEEVSKAQARFVELSNTQIDEMAVLMKASFNTMNELATEWRKLVMDASKRSAETFVR